MQKNTAGSSSEMNICLLHEYVLLKIFSFCNDNDLENLYFACRLFRWIIEERIYFLRTRSLLLCGHNSNLERNCEKILHRDRLHISSNWINGKYLESIYFPNRRFFATKIAIDNEFFYKSHGAYIRIHRRAKVDAIERRYAEEICTPIKTDITDFKKKNNTIFAGRDYGYGIIYEDGDVMEQRLHHGNEYIRTLDFMNDLFVTSSEDTCKLWSRSIEFGLSNLELVKDYKTPFKAVCMSNTGKIIGGKYSDKSRQALCEIDIETSNLLALNSSTFSIYDIKLKDDNVLFTANFDSTFRMFDRRTNLDECIWMDPFDASIYCLEYDGLYSVLCGMKHHGRVNLYDIRVPNEHVQMYFPHIRKDYGSPVYSLTCDSRYLFFATDHNIRVFDFKADYAPSKDYRKIFSNRILINVP